MFLSWRSCVLSNVFIFSESFELSVMCFLFLRFYLFIFRESGEKREKERERNIDVSEKHQSVAPCMCPHWGWHQQPRHVPWPGIDILLCGTVLSELDHTGQGMIFIFSSVDAMYDIDFQMLNQSCVSRINPASLWHIMFSFNVTRLALLVFLRIF